jgi:hypothetical protein
LSSESLSFACKPDGTIRTRARRRAFGDVVDKIAGADETLLAELRANRSTARETEAIRQIGLEIAIAIREVGAMLVNVGLEHRTPRRSGVRELQKRPLSAH